MCLCDKSSDSLSIHVSNAAQCRGLFNQNQDGKSAILHNTANHLLMRNPDDCSEQGEVYDGERSSNKVRSELAHVITAGIIFCTTSLMPLLDSPARM